MNNLLGEVIAQFLVFNRLTKQAAHDGIQYSSFCQVAHDVDVLTSQEVHVIWMALEFIVNGDDFKWLITEHALDNASQLFEVFCVQMANLV